MLVPGFRLGKMLDLKEGLFIVLSSIEHPASSIALLKQRS